MEVIFKNEHLQELYTSGKSSKYKKVPAQVVRKFPLAVRILQQLKVILDTILKNWKEQISIPCGWIEHGD